MKIENLWPGMTVYEVARSKMGNTSISTVSLLTMHIVSIDLEKRTVVATYDGIRNRPYAENKWSKWRAKRPQLVLQRLGNYRLAKRGEVRSKAAFK